MEYKEDLSEIAITLKIIGRDYKVKIARGNERMEELFREAARLMNSLIEQKREKTKGILNDEIDIILLSMLGFVYNTLGNEKSNAMRNELIENSIVEIKNLNYKLGEIISSLDELNEKE